MHHTKTVPFFLLLGLAAACNNRPVRPLIVDLGQRNIDSGDAQEGIDEPNEDGGIDTSGGDASENIPEEKQEDVPTEVKPVEPEKPKEAEKPKEPEKPVETEKPKEPTIRELFTEAQFNQLSEHRLPFYSYAAFVEAAESIPSFAKEGSIEIRKREIAAILANAMHESDEFKAINEYNTSVWGSYCMASAEYPCTPGKTYHGRGPIQLSWNYNYKDAGKFLGIDLVNNPDLVANDPKVAFKTMIWFWMKREGKESPICHDTMVKGKPFVDTIKTINGGLECNPYADRTNAKKQVEKRVAFFEKILKSMGLQFGNEPRDCV